MGWNHICRIKKKTEFSEDFLKPLKLEPFVVLLSINRIISGKIFVLIFLTRRCCQWKISLQTAQALYLFSKVEEIYQYIKECTLIIITNLENDARKSLVHILVHKVGIFWEGQKISRNFHLTFVYSTYRQK